MSHYLEFEFDCFVSMSQDLNICYQATWSLSRWKSSPRYRALSHMWGTKKDERWIQMKGHHTTIRSNLYHFLRVYAEDYQGQRIWIDQLCIDQTSTQERNHQVQLMSNIYRQASDVLVWLGHDGEPVIWDIDHSKMPFATRWNTIDTSS